VRWGGTISLSDSHQPNEYLESRAVRSSVSNALEPYTPSALCECEPVVCSRCEPHGF
jgi:hypothetical protein